MFTEISIHCSYAWDQLWVYLVWVYSHSWGPPGSLLIQAVLCKGNWCVRHLPGCVLMLVREVQESMENIQGLLRPALRNGTLLPTIKRRQT